MIKLLCGENSLVYTGEGYLKCGRHVVCPKKVNNKILGFDCFTYIDSLPEGCKVSTLEGSAEASVGSMIKERELIRTIEYIDY